MLSNQLRIPLLLGLSLALPALPARAATYLCFGDSITFHGGAPGYRDVLGRYLELVRPGGHFLENGGQPGELTDQGESRLKSILASRDFDYVLLLEGTNDLFAWVNDPTNFNMDQTVDNMRDMVDAIKADGAIPIVATIPPGFHNPADRDNSLAREYNSRLRGLGAAVADVYANMEPWLNPFVFDDTIHPTDLGQTLVAEAFAAAITGTPMSIIDLSPPIPVNIQPAPFASRVALTADLLLEVGEPKHPFDASTASLKIDGAAVVPAVSVSGSTYHYSYRFPQPLRFGQSVLVDFTVSDANTPTPNTLQMVYTITASAGNGTSGDIDLSGRIDGLDLALFAGSFGAARGDPRYLFEADIDASGFVDGLDLAVLTARFGGPP